MENPDINILEVDEKIKEMFEESKNKISEYTDSLKEVEEILAKSNIEKIIGKGTKELLEQKAKELRENINSILTSKEYGFYVLQSFQILDKYKDEIQKPVEIFFGKKTPTQTDCKDTINLYVDVASDICSLFGIETKQKLSNVQEKKTKRIRRSKDNKKKPKKKTLSCKNCKSKNLEILADEGYICQECFLQVDPIIIKASGEKTTSTLSKYQELDNFRTFMKQYQGKEDIDIKPEVIEFIKSKLDTSSLSSLKKVKRKQIYNILAKSKYEYYRKHSTFIWTQITGNSAPDLSDIEHLLEEDYKAYINVYNTKKSRTNALNTQISRSIFESLGWNYVSIY